MSIQVDISDRLYDYSDEEKAAQAIAEYQVTAGLSDEVIIALWERGNDPRRRQLERAIFDAVDVNGTAKRAQESVPRGIRLFVSEEA